MARRFIVSTTALATAALASAVLADVRITEYMYSGADGEFIEITNVGSSAVDLTGWSFDDSANVPGTFPISSIGVLAPGASAVITESTAASFRAAWGLSESIAIADQLGKPNGNNYGRNDTIVLYGARGEIIDRLDYGDQTFPGSIRTQNVSGWSDADGLGANDPFAWQLSVLGDAQGSYDSTLGARGNPGTFVVVGTPPGALGVVLTEYMYDGAGGEFVEFTNLSEDAVDASGWMLDDGNLGGGANGPFDVGALGVIAPGESVIVTEANAEAFRAAWGLAATVKVVGDLGKGHGNNLARNDEINIYDAGGRLVDRLTYGDEDFPGSIRTQNKSGWIDFRNLGGNDAFDWILATPADAQSSWVSSGADIGNPGTSPATPALAPGDANGDGLVNGADITVVLGEWGPCPSKGACAGDQNDDGAVDGADITMILGNWS